MLLVKKPLFTDLTRYLLPTYLGPAIMTIGSSLDAL